MDLEVQMDNESYKLKAIVVPTVSIRDDLLLGRVFNPRLLICANGEVTIHKPKAQVPTDEW